MNSRIFLAFFFVFLLGVPCSVLAQWNCPYHYGCGKRQVWKLTDLYFLFLALSILPCRYHLSVTKETKSYINYDLSKFTSKKLELNRIIFGKSGSLNNLYRSSSKDANRTYKAEIAFYHDPSVKPLLWIFSTLNWKKSRKEKHLFHSESLHSAGWSTLCIKQKNWENYGYFDLSTLCAGYIVLVIFIFIFVKFVSSIIRLLLSL